MWLNDEIVCQIIFLICNVFVIGVKGHMSPMSSSISSFHMFSGWEDFDFKLITSSSSFVCMCWIL